MKFNRQKIWFVSMLSLMAVLSAYYLLTEEVAEKNVAQLPAQTTQVAIDPPAEVVDEQVLQQLEQAEQADFFATFHMKQRDQLAKDTEKYMKIITNPESSTEAISSALAAMQQLEDRSEALTQLQETLQEHYADAIIQNEQEQWKVTVQSDRLERAQAVDIVQLVTRQLQVEPETVTVEYRP
jgi:stage III sporulation protein AH